MGERVQRHFEEILDDLKEKVLRLGGLTEQAIGRGNSRNRSEMADSVWVTRAAPDLPIVLAHELAHVLANSGTHVDLPGNLMRDASDPANTRLTAEQCAELIERGTAHGLLRPTGTE